jgi:hypothetical protein
VPARRRTRGTPGARPSRPAETAPGAARKASVSAERALPPLGGPPAALCASRRFLPRGGRAVERHARADLYRAGTGRNLTNGFGSGRPARHSMRRRRAAAGPRSGNQRPTCSPEKRRRRGGRRSCIRCRDLEAARRAARPAQLTAALTRHLPVDDVTAAGAPSQDAEFAPM